MDEENIYDWFEEGVMSVIVILWAICFVLSWEWFQLRLGYTLYNTDNLDSIEYLNKDFKGQIAYKIENDRLE